MQGKVWELVAWGWTMSLPAVLLYDSATPASSWAQDLFRSNVYIICAPHNAVFSIREDFKTVELPATVTI